MKKRARQRLFFPLLLSCLYFTFPLSAESDTTLVRLDLRGIAWVAAVIDDPSTLLEILPDSGERRYYLVIGRDSVYFWEYGIRSGVYWGRGMDYGVRLLPDGLELADARDRIFLRIRGHLEPGGAVVLEFEPPARAVLVASVAEATVIPVGLGEP